MKQILIGDETGKSILSNREITKEALDCLTFQKAEDSSIEVEIVNRPRMQMLNKKYMKKDCPTDVLSFPLPTIPGEESRGKKKIGTIVLCGDIIKQNAQLSGKTEREEFIFVLKHGIKHLLGIHHK